MKKILLIIILLLTLTACSSDYFKKINLKTLNSMLDKKESFVLYLTDETDEAKVLKNNILNVSKENNIKVYYLNTIKLSDEELKDLNKKFTFENTNIIIFVKNGQEETALSRISDLYTSKKVLKEEFKNQGFIK